MNLIDVLATMQDKKLQTNQAIKETSAITAQEVHDKVDWNSKVYNLALYLLAGALITLSLVCLKAYFILDAKIVEELHIVNQRIDNDQRFNSQRIDNALNSIRQADQSRGDAKRH